MNDRGKERSTKSDPEEGSVNPAGPHNVWELDSEEGISHNSSYDSVYVNKEDNKPNKKLKNNLLYI
jgi:hypothetical protein